MPRDIPVGNGCLLVNFDSNYCICDVYYPHVGHENHTSGHGFRFGLWTEGKFEWVGGKSWDLRLDYKDECMLTNVRAKSDYLAAEINSTDCVDHIENIFIRRINLRNLGDREREFRLFLHQDFHIHESAAGDTAYYDPDEKAVIHYKGKRYFLISGLRDAIQGIDQYSTGVKEFRGLEGTWRDAEDGSLEGNPIAQGSVDSVVSFSVKIPPHEERSVYYWICAGEDYASVSRLNKLISGHGVEYFLRRTENYWRAWINKEATDFGGLSPEVVRLFKRSLLILRTNIDRGGAIIAGCDSDVLHYSKDTYAYMWPRDGALTAYALDLAGYHGITRSFFDFCLRIIKSGKESVGFFLHKYNPDGSLGSSWHGWTANGKKMLPIQEDSTALVLWALWAHFERFRDIEFATEHYENMVRRCGDFLASYTDGSGLPLPSYDLWEEKWGVHTFTASAVYAGLIAAEKFSAFFGDSKRAKIYGNAALRLKATIEDRLYSKEHGRFLKSLTPGGDGAFAEDPTVDASIYAPFYFGVFGADDEKVISTMNAVRERLKTPSGGISRYEGDEYYKDAGNSQGNSWFICTIWLAQWLIAKAKAPGELEDALGVLDWVVTRALPSGVLAEQVHPLTNMPLSVSPLTWSHAAFVTAVLEYLKKADVVNVCPACGSPLRGRRPIETAFRA